METTRRIGLLYVLRDGVPVRHETPLATWELTCSSDGERWFVRAPGRWLPPGDVYEPEPAFVEAWLGSVVAPFGTKVEEGIYRIDNRPSWLAFEAAIAPHRSSVDPDSSDEERNAAKDRDADHLVEVLPDDALLRLERARLAVSGARRTVSPEAEIARALATLRDPETLLAASYVRSYAGDREGARALLREALDLDPTHERVGWQLHALLQSDHLAADALALDERLAVHRPRSAYAWERRARLLEGFGRAAEAVSAYDEALALERDRRTCVRLRAYRGLLLAMLGRDAEALEDLESSLPSYRLFEGYLAKGEVLARLGRREEAEQTLRWVAFSPANRAAAEALLARLGFAVSKG